MTALWNSPGGGFVDTVLRGVGQVLLQNNPLSGAIFLVGIFLGSWTVGLYALLGTVVATGTALLVGVPGGSVKQGLYGFNGTLTAIGLATYVTQGPILVGYVVFACVAVTIVAAAIYNLVNSEHVPTLTAAFVATTWVFLAGLRQFSGLSGAAALPAPRLPSESLSGGQALTPSDLLFGFFRGFSEVMLQTSVWTGVALLVGILVNSRVSATAAAAGSLIGFGVAWGFGASETTLRGGLAGYNAVLTAIALAGLYYLLSYRSALFAAVAAALSVVVDSMFGTVLAPVGLPVLTAPFVVTTWLCLFAASSFTRLHAVHPEDATTPEINLRSISRRWESLTPRNAGTR
ncbi:urea transporter [Streptomyces sp. NPDC050423]|uniref:urea transporter n=1 Tax=Streptomyces sp. NPDC050423 TaxID=3155402 RepID=UPI0034317202